MGHIASDKELEISTFQWPYPPYFKVQGEENPLLESCIVELLHKEMQTGMLTRFSPAEKRVLLQPFSNKPSQIIPFDQIKSLQLLSPTSIVSENDFLETRAEEVYQPSEKQPYKITFIDDSSISGETMGHVNDESGLYIYPIVNNNQIEKHFIPRQSIKEQQIGMQIGDILVEENHVTPKEVEQALDHQKELRTKRIGDYLNENQVISEEQLHQAISHQAGRPVLRLGEALQELVKY